MLSWRYRPLCMRVIGYAALHFTRWSLLLDPSHDFFVLRYFPSMSDILIRGGGRVVSLNRSEFELFEQYVITAVVPPCFRDWPRRNGGGTECLLRQCPTQRRRPREVNCGLYSLSIRISGKAKDWVREARWVREQIMLQRCTTERMSKNLRSRLPLQVPLGW